MVAKCISVCEVKDIEAWSVAAPNILKYISALKFEVIVPNEQVPVFRARTPSRIAVVPETSYMGNFSIDSCRAMLPPEVQSRAGWYYQQLIKITALSTGLMGEINLVWDADTVPLKPLNFIDNIGRLQYYRCRNGAVHQHYFDTHAKLTGDSRCSNSGFISQSFPARVEWVLEYCRVIEARHNMPWIDAILKAIDHSKGACGYSEYESLGNFFLKNWPGGIVFGERTFLRDGTRLIGRAIDLYDPVWNDLSDWVDYIAFEEYQDGRYTGLNIGCGNAPLGRTEDGGFYLNTDIDHSPWSNFEFDVTKTWPFPSGLFRHIVANNILEHVDDLISVCREADRCLNVGGLLQIEVPFLGSYNHGTDVTHKRGLTFESFNFLLGEKGNYLFRDPTRQPFFYRCISFHREIIDDNRLGREISNSIPPRGSYQEWIHLVNAMIIPGSFGFIFQKSQ